MPWTGVTAPSIALKMSTTALSFSMVFWSIVRAFLEREITIIEIIIFSSRDTTQKIPLKTKCLHCHPAWGLANYLQFPDNHEAEQTVQSIQAKSAQSVLDLREEPVAGHFLVVL